MSLDVYLRGPERTEECRCSECGHTHARTVRDELYSANITHNLNRMAGEAGLYEALWRPDEHGIAKAAQLVAPLREGLATLKADPARFSKLDAPNGWGRYPHLVDFVREYLAACEANPEADVQVSR